MTIFAETWESSGNTRSWACSVRLITHSPFTFTLPQTTSTETSATWRHSLQIILASYPSSNSTSWSTRWARERGCGKPLLLRKIFFLFYSAKRQWHLLSVGSSIARLPSIRENDDALHESIRSLQGLLSPWMPRKHKRDSEYLSHFNPLPSSPSQDAKYYFKTCVQLNAAYGLQKKYFPEHFVGSHYARPVPQF